MSTHSNVVDRRQCWVVFDANGGAERRITSAGTRQTAEVLRDLYLHCTPDAHPADVHITSR